MQTAIESEVTKFLGRERYSHGERSGAGSRNGHCPTTIKTTAGPVTIVRPKLRGTDEAFASRLLGVGAPSAPGRTARINESSTGPGPDVVRQMLRWCLPRRQGDVSPPTGGTRRGAWLEDDGGDPTGVRPAAAGRGRCPGALYPPVSAGVRRARVRQSWRTSLQAR
ncbi:hypothetical protein ACFFRE_03965 [Aciditerrimonas ferrireducens]|uniref:Mutator family transposase n=1 Tax=Aciditerrimonas ferrireducens TaxID=667306 RepID=A0ABV6C0V2_9ACTN